MKYISTRDKTFSVSGSEAIVKVFRATEGYLYPKPFRS